jgi:hypothetical protein
MNSSHVEISLKKTTSFVENGLELGNNSRKLKAKHHSIDMQGREI